MLQNKNDMSVNSALLYIVLGFIVLIAGCRKFYPFDKESIGPDSNYTTKSFAPILGKAYYKSQVFYYGSSTHPATYKIVNPRLYSGERANIFFDTFRVLAWNGEYTGLEKSLSEINKKREYQFRPLFEVNQHSGDIFMWPEANSKYFKTYPDSCYLFDVEYSNSGGRRYFKNLRLIPFKERAYEPVDIDEVSGIITNEVNHPALLGNPIFGAKTGIALSYKTIDVYLKKREASLKHQLTILILDPDNNFINPNKFTDTKWEELVHGFDMVKSSTAVTYQVAYPIPLRQLKTKYTNLLGEMAQIVLGYTRLGFEQAIERPRISFDFAIYEPGDWVLIFKFTKDAPKFENE